MKAAGIICEFNPFHNGHKYLFDNVRQDVKPDAVVCVMSGDFVQRGEPALWDKYDRAEMAVLSGADIVIELPVCFSLNAAKEFAKGGISILKSLGIIETLAFGSECGNAQILERIACNTYKETREFSDVLKIYLAQGMSYPAAYQCTLQDVFSDLNANIFTQPNNVLAIEYLKQNLLQEAGFKAYTMQRFGVGHDANSVSGEFASGKYLRELILEEGNITINYDKYVPECIKEKISVGIVPLSVINSNLFELLRYKVLTSTAEELADALEISEGLENKIKKEVLEAEALDDLIFKVKSKRYTYARISRILMQILLEINKSECEKAGELKNLRVLAFNNKGREVINEVGKIGNVNLITNIDKQYFDKNHDFYLDLDMKAADIYSIISSRNIYRKNDMVCNSIYCNI